MEISRLSSFKWGLCVDYGLWTHDVEVFEWIKLLSWKLGSFQILNLIYIDRMCAFREKKKTAVFAAIVAHFKFNHEGGIPFQNVV